MTDLVVAVRLKADGSAEVVGQAAAAGQAIQALARTASQGGAEMSRGFEAASTSTRGLGDELKGARRDISALLALNQLQPVVGDVINFGDVVAAVFAGRAVGAIGKYITTEAAAVAATKLEREESLKSAVALELRAAELTKASAAAGYGALASGASATAMQQEAASALEAAAALRTKAASATLASRATTALGGPAGLIMLGVSALSFWAISSSNAAKETDKLSESNKKLAESAKNVTREALAGQILALQKMREVALQNGAGAEALARYSQAIGVHQGKINALAKDQEALSKILGGTAREEEKHTDAVHEVTRELAEQRAELVLGERAYYSYQLTVKGFTEAEKAAALALWDGNKAIRDRIQDTQRWAEGWADASREFVALQDRLNPNDSAARQWLHDYQLLAKFLNGPELEAAAKKLGKEFAGADDSTARWAEGQADELRALLALQDRLNPNASAARSWLADYKLLAKYLSGPELEQAVEKLNKEFANTDGAKEGAAEIIQIYQDTATSVRDTWRGTFRAVLDDGVSGFKGFGDRLLSIFKDMLADMATLALARPVIIPMVTGMGQMLGVSSAAQASVIQQLGGGSGMGTLGNVGALGLFGSSFGGGLTAGLSGGFGMASTIFNGGATLGAGAAGWGASLGAFAGAALPWVAGALAIDKLTGGGLFGTSWKTKDAGLDLSIEGGDVLGQEYERQKRKRSMFRGSKSRTNYDDMDADLLGALNDSLDAGIEALLAGAAGLGADTAEQVLSGFSIQTRLSLKGKSDEEAQEAVQQWLDKTLTSMARAVLQDTRFSGLLIDASRDMAEALFTLGAFFAADPLRDAQEQQRLASRTLMQQYADQRSALDDLMRAYDGSTEATQTLAAATQERYQMEIALLNEISSVRSGIDSMMGDSIERIRQSVMQPKELSDYLSTQAEAIYAQLGQANDPAVIQELMTRFERYTSQAYDLIPDASRPDYASGYMEALAAAQNLANERLDAIQNSVQVDHGSITDAIQDSLGAASDQMIAAAKAQEEAAKEAARKLSEAATEIQKAAGRIQSFLGFSGGTYNYT